jgi:hypothetical protein
MPTPLESFMAALQKRLTAQDCTGKNVSQTSKSFVSPNVRMKCELTLPESQEAPPVSSLPAHTHTSESFCNPDAAMKCETKCEGPLTLPEAQVDWPVIWRELAQVTDGLSPDDARVGPVLFALAVCEARYKAGDLDGFTISAERVRRLMAFVPGASIRWDAVVGQRLVALGPARVEYVHNDNGQLFVFVTYQGVERWVSETILTTIMGPTP